MKLKIIYCFDFRAFLVGIRNCQSSKMSQSHPLSNKKTAICGKVVSLLFKDKSTIRQTSHLMLELALLCIN